MLINNTFLNDNKITNSFNKKLIRLVSELEDDWKDTCAVFQSFLLLKGEYLQFSEEYPSINGIKASCAIL